MLTSIVTLVHRILVKHQSLFFPPSKERGILRPRPADTFHVMACLFCLLSGIDIIFLLKEAYGNVAVAEIGFALPRVLTLSLTTLYPISLIYSIASLDPIAKRQIRWTHNTCMLDIISVSVILGPLVSVLPIAYLTGHLADNNNFKSANNILKLQYFLIGIWDLGYTISTILVWYKLNNVLRDYSKSLREIHRKGVYYQWRVMELKSFKWRLIGIFALLTCIYFTDGISRFAFVFVAKNPSIWKQGIGALFMIFWNYVPVVVITIVQIVLFCRKTALVPSQALQRASSQRSQRSRRSSHRFASIYDTSTATRPYVSGSGWFDQDAENTKNRPDISIEIPLDPIHAGHANVGTSSSSARDSNPTPFISPLRGSNIWDIDYTNKKKTSNSALSDAYRRGKLGKGVGRTSTVQFDDGSGTAPSPAVAVGLIDTATEDEADRAPEEIEENKETKEAAIDDDVEKGENGNGGNGGDGGEGGNGGNGGNGGDGGNGGNRGNGGDGGEGGNGGNGGNGENGGNGGNGKDGGVNHIRCAMSNVNV
ncbi:8940_t:CDS:2 [Paraglomus occultum]|uniref:8940_t:CDS:1 n=1 Tax=Paraglomus occultum TaxID=144539 RepID=A0A9N8YZA3_9GLOM|nr:8940_t:CDS:2 [Paraglomus occultum]